MPGGSILQAPFTPWIGIARAEVVLTGKDQAGIRKNSFVLINEYLCRLFSMRASKFIALSSRCHKPVQEIWLLLDLIRTGDNGRCVVVGDTVLRDVKSVQLQAFTLRLNTFPTFVDPFKIDLPGLQSLDRINI